MVDPYRAQRSPDDDAPETSLRFGTDRLIAVLLVLVALPSIVVGLVHHEDFGALMTIEAMVLVAGVASLAASFMRAK